MREDVARHCQCLPSRLLCLMNYVCGGERFYLPHSSLIHLPYSPSPCLCGTRPSSRPVYVTARDVFEWLSSASVRKHGCETFWQGSPFYLVWTCRSIWCGHASARARTHASFRISLLSRACVSRSTKSFRRCPRQRSLCQTCLTGDISCSRTKVTCGTLFQISPPSHQQLGFA